MTGKIGRLALACLALFSAVTGCSQNDSSSSSGSLPWWMSSPEPEILPPEYFVYDDIYRAFNLSLIVWDDGGEWRSTVTFIATYGLFVPVIVWYRQEHLNYSLEEMGDLVSLRLDMDDGDTVPIYIFIADNPAVFITYGDLQYRDYEEYAGDYTEVAEGLGLTGRWSEYVQSE